MDDTIVAISTSLGVGAISIVRVSGTDAIEIVNSIFKGKDLTKVKSHTINYGHIIYKGEVIDEVLVSVMRAPKTYTKEDIVEINCHGGISTTNKVLEALIESGARQAEPGEFTKRAFLNGRIDLTESEAVMDLIESKSDIERRLALQNESGALKEMITKYRDKLKDLISHIEVNIDYPEYYDIEVVDDKKINDSLDYLIKELKHLIKESEGKKIIKTGIKTVIVGRPNVGKSSILNKLLNYNKAIVTDIEGTTRDIVEGDIYIDGIHLNMIDTAGIRKTDNKIEKIGVEKSLSLIDDADLVLVVLDESKLLTKEDKEILDKTKNKTSIVVLNKSDLTKKINETDLKGRNVVETNTVDEKGLESLKNEIRTLFNLDKIEVLDYTYLSSARSLALARKALSSLESAKESAITNSPIDLLEIDIKDAFDDLGEITGETASDEIIDNLFKNFCVGK